MAGTSQIEERETAVGGRTPADDALLAVARMSMDASVRSADEVGGLSPVQLRALTVLLQFSGANLVQLADEMGVTVSTASRLVGRLVAAGWVRRRPSPANRREVTLTLTDDGRSLLRRYDDGRLRRLRACLDEVPPDRRDGVVAALADFAAVDVAPAPAGEPVAGRSDRELTGPGIR